jgi:hypothetical protein
VMIRAVGPTLAALGVANALNDPVLKVFQGSTLLAENDDWGVGNVAQLTAAFTRGGMMQFSGTASKDAAIFMTLQPGVYTAQVRAADGVSGVGLVEVYDVP